MTGEGPDAAVGPAEEEGVVELTLLIVEEDDAARGVCS